MNYRGFRSGMVDLSERQGIRPGSKGGERGKNTGYYGRCVVVGWVIEEDSERIRESDHRLDWSPLRGN